MKDPTATAAMLFENRMTRRVVDDLPADLKPVDSDQAYAVQDHLVSRMASARSSSPCGYKIACTNPRVQELLRVSEPLSGCLLSHSMYADGDQLAADDFRLRVMEPEFVFTVSADVPPGAVQGAEAMVDYIGDFRPGLEIVNHHFTDFTAVGGLALAADNAIHGGLVAGDPNHDWEKVDLAAHAVALRVNGELFDHGNGANVLGSPLNAMAWLANHLERRGRQLRAGDVVTTGTATQVYYAQSGDIIEADFGELGRVACTFA